MYPDTSIFEQMPADELPGAVEVKADGTPVPPKPPKLPGKKGRPPGSLNKKTLAKLANGQPVKVYAPVLTLPQTKPEAVADHVQPPAPLTAETPPAPAFPPPAPLSPPPPPAVPPVVESPPEPQQPPRYTPRRRRF
jgi:hypothetical protein